MTLERFLWYVQYNNWQCPINISESRWKAMFRFFTARNELGEPFNYD